MTSVTIFGDGNMGTAINSVFSAGGATVEHLNTESPAGSPVNGDIVVLAVPHPAVDAILEGYADQLAGKIVVDITNPVNFETFDSLVVPADSSKTAELAAKLPDAKVVKAFNTNFAATLAGKAVGDNQTTVLIAGEDDAAKSTLAEAVKAGGLNALDAGGLNRARELEAIGFLQIKLAASEQVGWTNGFAVIS